MRGWPMRSSSGSVRAPLAMMSPWISSATSTPASSAAFASASMLARNADSFSSWLECPPIAVLMTGRP